jgi:hypothetical protein
MNVSYRLITSVIHHSRTPPAVPLSSARMTKMKKTIVDLNLLRNAHPWLAIEQRRLFSRHPLFFRSVHYPAAYPSNVALLGIRCGLGWYPVIEEAAQEIEQELNSEWCNQVRIPGNIASLDYDVRPNSPSFSSAYPIMSFCSDIYEAWGQLEISVVGGYLCHPSASQRIKESIKRAQARACTVCERCGAPGTFRGDDWQHVFCNECIAPKLTPDSFDADVANGNL